MATRLQLGAPGIYELPSEPIRALTGSRMDVCAFVGVAPRGPARPPLFVGANWAPLPGDGDRASWPRAVAVPVESFDAYQRLYGGFEGPGLLPYAVASFFENGGIRAYIARIVPAYDADPSQADAHTAKGTLLRQKPPSEASGDDPLRTTSALPILLRARSEGLWGNALTARLSFASRPLVVQSATLTALQIPVDRDLAAGTCLQLTYPGGATVMRFVVSVRDEWDPSQPRAALQRWVDLSVSLPLVPPVDARVALVEGTLVLDDGAGRVEQHEGLGLSSSHPRWLARVLYEESILVSPTQDWLAEDLNIRGDLPPYQALLAGGADDFRTIAAADFFDPDWVLGDPTPGDGIQSLANLPELASLCVPDLYSPAPLVERQQVEVLQRCGPTFERSLPMVSPPAPLPPQQDLDGLRLDPEADLDAIIALQQSVVTFAEQLGVTALLDVPPRLHRREILRWRGRFSSPYAAAYHPWLRVSRLDDARGALIRVPPSAVAAGIIAQRELAFGIPHGPANVIAQGVVDVDDGVSPTLHAEIHPLGVNVYLKERDGVRLTAARTLSADPSYRQLSVRRLVTMLRRTLDQQMQWAVFEPNNAALRRDLRQMISAYLSELFRLNAFTGARESEAFFVRCDDALNPPRISDAGQLLCEVGVAPAEPLEFIVLRIERGGDGTIRVEG